MLRELYTNGIVTTLNEALDSSETGVDVTDASTWPTNNFRVKVDDEIMFCTSRSSNTLTVIRGAEGTSAASHSNSAPINHILTAGALSALRADMLAIMGFGRVPTTGNTYGDEFDDESFSGWTAVNSGSAPLYTVVEQDHMLSLLHPGGGSTGQWLSYMKDTGATLSTGNSWDICFRANHNSSGFSQVTLWAADGATYGAGVQAGFAFSPHENTFAHRGSTNYNNQTTFTSTNGGVSAGVNMNWDVHLRMEYRGSNQFHCYFSSNGIQWAKIFNNANPTTITPRYIGFGFTTWGGSGEAIVTVRSFRTNF